MHPGFREMPGGCGQAGNEIQSPMAVVILGGLLSSTFLNLLVIPSVYLLMKRRKESRELV